MNEENTALLDEFCDTVWLEDGLAKNTLESYRRDLRQYAHWLEAQGRGSLLAATEADLSGYFGSRYAGASYYIDGHQAAKSMRYITVTLKVDNRLSQVAIIGSPYDYIRLKSGNITAPPKATTLPVSFEIGAMGKTGTVTFLMPQDSTTFTLVLLPQSQSGFDQASIDFQLS